MLPPTPVQREEEVWVWQVVTPPLLLPNPKWDWLRSADLPSYIKRAWVFSLAPQVVALSGAHGLRLEADVILFRGILGRGQRSEWAAVEAEAGFPPSREQCLVLQDCLCRPHFSIPCGLNASKTDCNDTLADLATRQQQRELVSCSPGSERRTDEQSDGRNTAKKDSVRRSPARVSMTRSTTRNTEVTARVLSQPLYTIRSWR